MTATDIAGYTYNAQVLCPGCTVRALEASNEAFQPPADSPPVEQWLDFIAVHLGINRYDEREFDSSDFPKVVFSSQVEADECDDCGEYLGGS